MDNMYFDDVFAIICSLDEAFFFNDINFNYSDYGKFKNLDILDKE